MEHFHHRLKGALLNSINSVLTNPSAYARNPQKDFIRNRKINGNQLCLFLISCGASKTQSELLDFYGSEDVPSASALVQQRNKFKPEGMEAVFKAFGKELEALSPLDSPSKYRFLAVDGSSLTFQSCPRYASDDYLISDRSESGHYSMHLNALYDLDRHEYKDCIIQSAHGKDEHAAFCEMVDRFPDSSGSRAVFIADRGYCSLNNMAHVKEKGLYFVFRAKDIGSKGLTKSLNLPDEDNFDVQVNAAVVRSQSRKVSVECDHQCYVGQNTAFDFLEYGSLDSYELSFRVVRFPLGEDSNECIITNLPEDDFPFECFKELYFKRWAIEVSFRDLKYTNGLTVLHSYKPDHIKQEIWGTLILYNFVSALINHAGTPKSGSKHKHKSNFGVAAHEARKFIQSAQGALNNSLMNIIARFTVPCRPGRNAPRNFHPRKPPDCVYRPA